MIHVIPQLKKIYCLSVSYCILFKYNFFWICANFNVFRAVLLELLPTLPSFHTSLQLKSTTLVAHGYRSMFKTAVLVYKFLYSGNPKYFEPFLVPRYRAYNTCRSKSDLFIYLFGVLHHFQHCTGHITTGSWKGRRNQYIQFVRVLCCKLLTSGKQLPTTIFAT